MEGKNNHPPTNLFFGEMMRLPDTLRTHDEIIFCVISNGFYLCLHFLGSSVPDIPDPEEDDNGDTAIFKKTTFDKNKYTCTLQIL